MWIVVPFPVIGRGNCDGWYNFSIALLECWGQNGWNMIEHIIYIIVMTPDY